MQGGAQPLFWQSYSAHTDGTGGGPCPAEWERGDAYGSRADTLVIGQAREEACEG